MIIVLDTTETHDDLLLEGQNFTFLQEFLNKQDASLVIPQIVVEETINHFVEKVTEFSTKVRDNFSELKRLVLSLKDQPPIPVDLEKVTEEFKARLKARLKILRATQPEYSSIAMPAVVERALKRRKPFDSNGRVGFRDALLWETVLSIAGKESDQVVLVTRNKNDFGDHGNLAKDLGDDLERRGLDRDRVQVCHGLAKFVDEYVKPHLKQLKEIEEQLRAGTFKPFDVTAFYQLSRYEIEETARRRFPADQFERKLHQEEAILESPQLVHLESSPHGVEVAEVYQVNRDDISVSVDYTVEGKVEYDIDTTGPRERPSYETEQANVVLLLQMSVVVNLKSGEIKNWELAGVEIVD